MIGKLISRWLTSSYAYYRLGESLMLDSEYDDLSNELLDRLEEVKNSDHPHKNLVTEKRLISGSSDIPWPSIVKFSASRQVKEMKK